MLIGGALTRTTGAGADQILVGSNNTFRVGGAAEFTLGTTAVSNGNDGLQINNAQFASILSLVGGAGSDGLHIGDLASVGIAGKWTVNAKPATIISTSARSTIPTRSSACWSLRPSTAARAAAAW